MRISFSAHKNRGFTLIEMMVVLGIIASLAALSYPVAIHGTRQFKFIQCLNNARKIGRATIQCLNEGSGADSADAWRQKLVDYGISERLWACPLRVKEGRSRVGDCDFLYAGAEPTTIQTGDRLGELYLWVEKMPNHNGLHVCAMGDGTVRTENLLGVSQ